MSSSSTSMCTDEGLEEVMVSLVEKGLINDSQPSVDIFDLDYFRGRLRAARAAFVEPFVLNAMALKANSIRGVMKTAKEEGFGAECASISEAVHALSMGFKPEDIIFDSPCKTRVIRIEKS
jgi:diaminopimelate decarboxylase